MVMIFLTVHLNTCTMTKIGLTSSPLQLFMSKEHELIDKDLAGVRVY